MTERRDDTALVLGGGGMRGAYEAGVLSGIVQVLGLGVGDVAPFRIFAGSSVGAVNAAFVASYAHRGDMNASGLAALWTGLDLSETLTVRSSRYLRLLLGRLRLQAPGAGSLLSPRFLEERLTKHVAWPELHRNVQGGLVRALLIPVLEIATGRTTVFAELAPGVTFSPSSNPRRQARGEPITFDHVMGSAALPLLFPARRIGERYYCDGGLRFNTPIAPAIRCGATRIVVISPKHEPLDGELPEPDGSAYPSLPFLLGKVLNALLLDPVSYDLQVLTRFNRLVEILERSVPAEAMDEISRLMIESRGAPYRRIETLAFSPSEDIGAIAAAHAKRCLERGTGLGRLARSFLEFASTERYQGAGDLASHLLFDGVFAEELIRLGRADARGRAEEVRRFFSSGADGTRSRSSEVG